MYTVSGIDGAFGRRGLGATSMMTICFDTCTCGTARPAPSYSYMVSIISSINCWTAGVRIWSGGTGSATWRSTGCPRRATLNIIGVTLLHAGSAQAVLRSILLQKQVVRNEASAGIDHYSSIRYR